MRGRVEISGINTAKLPVLKNDEMTALLRRAHAGDTAAREQLICGNLRLVLSVLQRFAGRGESADDLFQVGCIGLMKAIDNFDVEQPVRFSTYGVPMIVGEIRRYLRDNSALRISRSMRDTAYKILRAREALLVETQREPTVEQLARYLDIPREDVVFAMDAFSDPVSLYEPLYADSGDTVCVMDQVRDEKNTDESWLDRIALKDAIARLDPRQRSILALRFCFRSRECDINVHQVDAGNLCIRNRSKIYFHSCCSSFLGSKNRGRMPRKKTRRIGSYLSVILSYLWENSKKKRCCNRNRTSNRKFYGFSKL